MVSRPNELSRRVLHAVPDPIVVIEGSGRISYANRAFALLTGTSVAALIGKKMESVLEELFDTEATRHLIDPQSDENRPDAVEPHLASPKGADPRWFEIWSMALAAPTSRKEVIYQFREVTSRESVRAQLGERENRIRALMESAPVGIALIAENGELLESNRLAASLLKGMSGSTSLPTCLYDEPLIAGSSLVRDLKQVACKRQPAGGEITCVSADQRGLVIAYHLRPLAGEPPSPPRILTVLEDYTERKRHIMRMAEEQRRAAIETFTGGIAHEFNNLHQIIRGYAEVLATRKRTGDCGEDEVREILVASRKATDLVSELLTAGARSPRDPYPFDLNAFISATVADLSSVVLRRVEVKLVLDPALPKFFASSSDIRTILFSLATNARDACGSDGRVEIETASLPAIVDSGAAESATDAPGKGESWILIRFSDNGSGMIDATLQNIYDPFFTTKEVGKGRGMGLAIVRGIVAGMGGYVECASAPGAGTSFRLFLPNRLPT